MSLTGIVSTGLGFWAWVVEDWMIEESRRAATLKKNARLMNLTWS
jgi:hypothetical protein